MNAYLTEVDAQSRRYIEDRYPSGALSPELERSTRAAGQFRFVEPILDLLAALGSVEIRQVGIVDVLGRSGPPYVFHVGGADRPQVPSGAYWLDTVVNFGEQVRGPFGSPVREFREYPLRFWLQSSGGVLGISCPLVADLAPGPYTDTLEPRHLRAVRPVLDPSEGWFDTFASAAGGDVGPVLVSILGPTPPAVKRHLRIEAVGVSKTVTLKLQLQLPGLQVSREDLEDFIRALRDFDEWVHRGYVV